jgi:ubiquitin-like 1-activating enzyme E1 B
MEELWKTRKKPVPLDIDSFEMSQEGYNGSMLDWDQKPWSLQETVRVFKESLSNLSNSLLAQRKIDSEATLSFDKDDEDALNFVTAAANLRAQVFGIQPESRFKVKEMAGIFFLLILR